MKRGFTLIELLVVISIISLLSSILLASLSLAKAKAKIAATQLQFSGLKTQSGLFYSANNTYSGICSAALSAYGFGGATGPGPLDSLQRVNVTGGGGVLINNNGRCSYITCNDGNSGWAVEAPANKDNPSNNCGDWSNPNFKMWCTDSSGALRLEPPLVNLTTGVVTCP